MKLRVQGLHAQLTYAIHVRAVPPREERTLTLRPVPRGTGNWLVPVRAVCTDLNSNL